MMIIARKMYTYIINLKTTTLTLLQYKTMASTNTFLDQYWKFQQEAFDRYNAHTIVLIEKGSFMECYATDTFGCAGKVAKQLNMIMTQCNKNLAVSNTNPYMVGFPKAAHEKNVPILIANDWTIVWVEQVWDHQRKSILRREITRVITPGTYMEHPPTDDFYYICCIHTVGSVHYVIVIDTSIGFSETLTLDRDEDLVWFVGVYNPREVLSINTSPFVRTCFRGQVGVVMYEKAPAPYNDQMYQNQVFSKVIGECGNDLIPQSAMNTAIACLFDFVWACYPKALSHIKFPKDNAFCAKHMSLHNNTVSQLDLLPSANGKGVFGKVNKTRTCMGQRLLKHQLLHPMVVAEEIDDAHASVECCLNNSKYMEMVQKVLANIPDVDRLLKRIDLGVATPQQVAAVHASMHEASVRLEIADPTSLLFEWDVVYDRDTLDFVRGHDDIYDALKVRERALRTDIESRYLKPFSMYCCKLENIKDKGFVITTTHKKGEQVHKQHPHLSPKRLTASAMYLSGTDMDHLCQEYTRTVDEQADRFKEVFRAWMATISTTYGDRVREISQGIAELDCACSKAQCAMEFGHIRPSIMCDSEHACVHASAVRHPLLDNYIGNDCTLDEDSVGGILLYGINGSGKSCYAKSIAVNLILAQAGFYVSADTFRFSPFTKVFTRIHCDDNMYKGLSSFSVEMTELRSILRLADKRSLVIGDELCKGTEDLSAVSIVAASVKWMADNQVKYIFATHLHKLPSIDFVAAISNLSIKHMKSEYDTQLKSLVFKRKLDEGQGDPLYGIEVARHILGFPEITNMAMMARKQIVADQEGTTNMASTKRSRYNKRLSMDECAFCKSTHSLHTHHINPQSNFSGENKNNMVMNRLDNLLVLCAECHDKIHHDQIKVTMVHTLDGLKPRFE